MLEANTDAGAIAHTAIATKIGVHLYESATRRQPLGRMIRSSFVEDAQGHV